MAGAGLWGAGGAVWAAEHGGKEHGGMEHAGTAQQETAQTATPAAERPPMPSQEEMIRQVIQLQVQRNAQQDGGLRVEDPVTGTTRTLELVRVHDRVGKTGSLYYACTDMRDTASGESLDLDFDVEVDGPRMRVVETRIHKVNGQARYTYDEHDKRIPVAPTGSQEKPQKL